MISYKFSGHLNSNIFVRVDIETSMAQLWAEFLVPLIKESFSLQHQQAISQALLCPVDSDECLNQLYELGALYVDQIRKHQDFFIAPTQVLRIHLMPRRYNIKRFHFGNSMIFEDENYLVIQKPALLPVHPTVDNFKENLLMALQLHFKQTIYSIHRLDLETTGLILFAKNESAMNYYNALFEKKQIQKFYKAVIKKNKTAEKLRPGLYQHWLVKSKRSPKTILNLETQNSTPIELKVLSVTDYILPGTELIDLELLTGKTHQIRAQLSHLGCPLLGDHLYGGQLFSDGLTQSHFLLHAYRLEFYDQSGQRRQFEQQPSWQ